MTSIIILAALLAGLVLLARWRWKARKFVPKNRVRTLRLRLHLGMRPGHGFATLFELWLRWGRFAAWRKSRRVRRSLPWWYRLTHPETHSIMLGRAQRGHALRVPMEQHVLAVAGPRTGKSALLSALIMHYPGPAVVTSSRTDLFELTSGIRAQRGPVALFSPQGLAGLPSTVRFNPIDGCEDPQVAIRRADAFAGAVEVGAVEGADYFQQKCSSYLRALFLAAALTGADLRLVSRWVLTSTEPAERILTAAGYDAWAGELSELHGPAEKSAATTKSVMTRSLSFLNDPQLAASVTHGDFDIRSFLTSGGTIYMVAASQQKASPMAPVFAMLAGEIHYEAAMFGSTLPGGRMDPPLGMFLDEIVQVCPVPVASWLSDSGGRGIQIVTVAHSWSQLAEKWGEHSAQTIFETSGVKAILPGVTDTVLLERFSKLCGQFSQRARYQDHHSQHDVLTPAQIRQLPDGYGLIVAGNRAPVIGRLERGWKQPVYRQASKSGTALAALGSAAELDAVPTEAIGTDERPAVEAQPVGVTSSLLAENEDVWEVRS